MVEEDVAIVAGLPCGQTDAITQPGVRIERAYLS